MNYIISKHTSKVYNYHPQTKDELKKLINKLIKERGNKANLNDIDTSAITNMSYIFYKSDFNGDISNWNVSNVKDMSYMFSDSEFTGKNGNISGWDVSNVIDMYYMFANSKFTGKNGDLSRWDTSNVKYKSCMFVYSPLQNNQPSWYKQ